MRIGDYYIHAGNSRKITAINPRKGLFRIKDFRWDLYIDECRFIKNEDQPDYWENYCDLEKERDKKHGWKFCECED